MQKQTGINSSDSMHENSNPQDNFPLIYSGSSGQLNVPEVGSKKELESNLPQEMNPSSPQSHQQQPQENQGETHSSKNKFSKSSSFQSKNVLGGEKEKEGGSSSSNNFQESNKQDKLDDQNTLDKYSEYNYQYSFEQADIKINQPDSFALSDGNQGQLLQMTENQFRQHQSSQDLLEEQGHISEQQETEKTQTDLNASESNKSKQNKSSIRSNTHQDKHSNSNQNNSNSNGQSKGNSFKDIIDRKLAANESYDEFNRPQTMNQFRNNPKRDPEYGGGSEPIIVQRNISGFNPNNQKQIASSQAVGAIQRNASCGDQNEYYTPDSQKLNSDQDSSRSRYSGESSVAQSSFKLLQKGQYKDLKEFCKLKRWRYTDIFNEQGNNMIIKAVQNKDKEGVIQLLKDAKQQLQDEGLTNDQIQQEIVSWINKESKQGYTAAHFSCYIGDPDILILLKEEGADFMKLNNEGSSGLHVASQNDSIASIIFLLLLGININIEDQKNATPLHWASFQGLDQSVQFLIAFGAKVNMRDSEGMTPLILSSISGSMKIVRMLLLAGSDRNQKDNKDRTALYTVTEDPDNLNPDIAEMLKRTNGFQEYWNIRPVFKPTRKNPKQVIYYLIMYIFCQLSLVYFNYTLWNHATKIGILITLLTLALLTKFFFFNSWLRNPGYISHNKNKKSMKDIERFKQLERMYFESYNNKREGNNVYSKEPLEKNARDKLIELFLLLQKEQDSSQICAHCCILKPKRSRHCDICQHCVSVYDHHCPWINNCVGTMNHGYFLGYVICIWISILLFTAINVTYIWQNDYPIQHSSVSSPIYIDPLNIFPADQNVIFFILKIVAGAISLFFSLLFGLPLTLLLSVQIGNFRQNKTTYERFSQQARHQHAQNDSNRFSTIPPDDSQINQSFLNETNTQNPSTLQNCLQMCIHNKKNNNFLFRSVQENEGYQKI